MPRVTKPRAVIYDRVSESDPESQAAHLRTCRKFADARGWRVVSEHVDTASGFSRSAKRPGWDAVVGLVERQEVDVALVFAVSRAGRNVVRFASFVELCRDRGVTFASATEPIDTSGPMGEVILTLLASLAQMESATKRERALIGEEAHRRNGTYRGGNIAYGLRLAADGQHLEVDPTEAATIRQAATDLLNGKSLERIAEDWNAAGITTHGGNGKPGGPWSGSHVRALLGAERNVEHGIVAASDHRRMTALFDSRKTGRAPDRYLLSGLVFSLADGKGQPPRRMVGRQGRYVDWRATERPRGRLSVRSHLLEEHVYDLAAAHTLPQVAAWDPTDDLVKDRERVVGELEALGESTLSEHVLAGRERRLLRELAAVEEQLEQVKPADVQPFFAAYPEHDLPDAGTMIRGRVKRVLVSPATRPSPRFDPSRVTIEWR